jgi:hypothetical protein
MIIDFVEKPLNKEKLQQLKERFYKIEKVAFKAE